MWKQILSPYLNNADPNPTSRNSVFNCPDDTQILMPDGVTMDYISYGVNGFVSGDYSGGSGASEKFNLKLSEIEREREVIFAGDTDKVVAYSWGAFGFTPDDWVRAGNINGDDGDASEAPGCQHIGAAYSDACVSWVKEWITEDHTSGFDPSNGATCQLSNGINHNSVWACRAPAFRHARNGNRTGIANFSFLDGHAHGFHFGEEKTWNFIPNESPVQPAL